jgi:hypothetical protein
LGATYIVGLLFVFFPNVSSSRRADEILKLILNWRSQYNFLLLVTELFWGAVTQHLGNLEESHNYGSRHDIPTRIDSTQCCILLRGRNEREIWHNIP